MLIRLRRPSAGVNAWLQGTFALLAATLRLIHRAPQGEYCLGAQIVKGIKSHEQIPHWLLCHFSLEACVISGSESHSRTGSGKAKKTEGGRIPDDVQGCALP